MPFSAAVYTGRPSSSYFQQQLPGLGDAATECRAGASGGSRRAPRRPLSEGFETGSSGANQQSRGWTSGSRRNPNHVRQRAQHRPPTWPSITGGEPREEGTQAAAKRLRKDRESAAVAILGLQRQRDQQHRERLARMRRKRTGWGTVAGTEPGAPGYRGALATIQVVGGAAPQSLSALQL